MKRFILIMIFSTIFGWTIFSQDFDFIPQRGHKEFVKQLSYSPDGKKLISISTLDNKLICWDINTGKEYASINDPVKSPSSVVFTGDGKSIVTTTRLGKSIIFYDFETLQTIKELKDFKPYLNSKIMNFDSLILTKSERYCIVLAKDTIKIKFILFIDMKSSEIVFEINNNDGIDEVVITEDEKYFAYSDNKGKVFLYDFQLRKQLYSYDVNEPYNLSLCFSPDGKHLIGGSLRGDLYLWKTEDLSLINKIKAHGSSSITSCKFSSDSKKIITTSEDKSIAVWNFSDMSQIFKKKFNDTVYYAAFSPDNKKITLSDRTSLITIIDSETGEVDKELRGKGNEIKNVLFSPQSDFIYFDSSNTVKALSLEDLSSKVINEHKKIGNIFGLKLENKSIVDDIIITNDNNYITSNSYEENCIRIYDLSQRKNISSIKYDKYSSKHENIALTGDNKSIISVEKNLNTEKIFITQYNIPQLEKINSIETGFKIFSIPKIAISKDSKYFAVIGDNPKDIPYFLWTLPDFKQVDTPLLKPYIWDYTKPNDYLFGSRSVDISKDSQFITVGDGKGFVRLYGIPDGGLKWEKQIYNFDGAIRFSVNSVKFDNENNFIVTAGDGKDIVILDAKNGNITRRLSGHLDTVNSLDISKDGKFLVSAGDDSFIKLWDYQTGENLITAISSSKSDWLVFSNDGFFDSSRNGGEGIAVVNRQTKDVFNIDQFAINKNRPDKLLEKIYSQNKELISHFYSQFLKRIKKLKIDTRITNLNNLPECIINKTEREGNFLAINFSISDKKHPLSSYNIFVNDVPLFGGNGKEITVIVNKGQKPLVFNEKIELSKGNNKIEISALNKAGLESYRASVTVINDGENKGLIPLTDLYYIGFGVSKYKDSTLNLRYADKDALDLAEVFKNQKTNFNNIYTYTFVNEECTVSNIKKAKELLKNSKPDDTFVLFIAGHGVHDTDKEATYYYLTHETDLKNLSKTAANFELIEDILQGIPPRNKLFLMDTCESGEIEEDNINDSIALLSDNTRSIKARSVNQERGLKNINTKKRVRSYLFEKDRYIYNDLSRRSGAIVFSSCKGGEFSYEDGTLQNGFFTFELKKAITSDVADINKDKLVSTDELREYVSKTVSSLSNGLQNPTVDRDNIYQKFGFGY